MNLEKALIEVKQFLKRYDINKLPLKNNNIHYVNSSDNFKKINIEIQKNIQNKKMDIAIIKYIELIENEACKLNVSQILRSLYLATFKCKMYEETLQLIELSKSAGDEYMPYIDVNHDYYINSIKNNKKL